MVSKLLSARLRHYLVRTQQGCFYHLLLQTFSEWQSQAHHQSFSHQFTLQAFKYLPTLIGGNKEISRHTSKSGKLTEHLPSTNIPGAGIRNNVLTATWGETVDKPARIDWGIRVGPPFLGLQLNPPELDPDGQSAVAESDSDPPVCLAPAPALSKEVWARDLPETSTNHGNRCQETLQAAVALTVSTSNAKPVSSGSSGKICCNTTSQCSTALFCFYFYSSAPSHKRNVLCDMASDCDNS